MPLDLLLKNSGDYERMHQLMLFTLFSEGRFAEELGLPAVEKVEWEARRGLFDLVLGHGARGETGIEVKTWSQVGDSQADRQRAWTKEGSRSVAYVLMGSAEFVGVPGDPIDKERVIGVKALRDASHRLASRADSSAAVRGLAQAYAKWLSDHDAIRESSTEKEEWSLLAFSVFYSRIKALLPWSSSIYQVNNPGGPVYIMNFDEDWLELKDARATGACLYWELVNGFPYFKIGEILEGSDGRAIRDELRELFTQTASQKGLEIVQTGRLGKFMSLARSTIDTTALMVGDRVDEKAVRDHLSLCRDVHQAVYKKWQRR